MAEIQGNVTLEETIEGNVHTNPDPMSVTKVQVVNALGYTPADEEDLKLVDDKVETLREVVSKFHSNIVCEAKGEVITLDNASDMELAGLKIYGKTTQNGTPNPEAPVPLESVGESVTVTACGKNLFTLNDLRPTSIGDGDCEVNGNTVRVYSLQSTTRAGVRTRKAISLVGGVTYVISANVDTIISGTPSIGLRDAVTASYVVRKDATKIGKVMLTYTPAEDIEVWVCLLCTSSIAENGDVIFSDIQFEIGTVSSDYEPHTATTAILTPVTSDGESLYLSGIPVSSGGNYKDANGQEWICDYLDFSQRKYIQMVQVNEYNGSENWSLGSSGNAMVTSLSANPAVSGVRCLCSHYLWSNNASDTKRIAVYSALNIYDDTITTVEDWKTMLGNNPIIVMYALATPKNHDLSDEALAQFASLHTNYPNTTIFNDVGADMEVKYIADTKLYVDKKFEELASAIVSKT